MTYKIPAVSVILNQFPEFTREDYPAFIKFVELYYKHLNETQVEGIGQSFESIRDIDSTIDKFVDELWKEFGINIPRTTNINDRYFLKHIKDFYSAKGSEESFRILFRHLYDTEIEIKYPKEQILIPSDGKWTQNISIIVNATSGDIFKIIDQRISIITELQTIAVTANSVRLLDDGHYEVFLDKFQRDLISIGSILSLNDISATVVETISNVTVYKQGKGFYLGQIFTIPSYSGTGARVKVIRVGSLGELLEVQLLDFGSGYNLDFDTYVTSGTTPSIVQTGKLASQTYGFVDKGFISSNFYSDLDYTTGSYSGEVIREFYTRIDVPEGSILDDDKTAVLQIKIGAIRRYPGFYEDSSGFLSDTYRIQDGYYYQNYSYVISCVESINTYRNIIKALVHPSGFKLFGNQVFSNSFDVVGQLELVNRYFQMALNDSFELTDVNKYVLNKSLTDSLTISDSGTYARYVTINKPLAETLSLVETETFGLSKPLSDSVSITAETETLDFSKNLTETVVITETETVAMDKPLAVETLSLAETETLTYNKNLTEALTLSETSETLSIGKYLTDTFTFLGIYYWDTDYANMAYTDTNIEPVISKAGSTYSISLTN